MRLTGNFNWLRGLSIGLLMACLWLGAGGISSGADKSPALTEPQVKALFLFNFVRYVEWPATAFPQTNAPIVIGLVGASTLTEYLHHLIEGKTANGRSVVVVRADDDSSQRGCHLLFVPAEEKRRWPEIQRNLAGAPVLTVSDAEQFLDAGGAVNLVKREKKIRLEISQPAAKRAGLKISSKLLGVADLVVRDFPEEP